MRPQYEKPGDGEKPVLEVLGNLQPFEPPLHYWPGLSLIALTQPGPIIDTTPASLLVPE
jgi:hypothetical protein